MLRVNAAAFFYNYKSLQLGNLASINGLPSFITANAGAARVKGIEVESTVVPDHHNRLDISVSYLDAYYAQYQPTPAISYNGNSLDHSPRIVVMAGYTYTYPLANGTTHRGQRPFADERGNMSSPPIRSRRNTASPATHAPTST